MAKKIATKNQNFKKIMENLTTFLTDNEYMDEIGNASKITLKDECDDTCLDCRTFSEVRDDPKNPGRKIIVLVRKCVS